MNRLSYSAFSLLCFSQAFAGDSVVIPEGKIPDFPCTFPDITPSAGPRVIDGADLFLTADYLYWIARENNLQFATTGYSSNGTSSTQEGVNKSPSFHHQTGFRAGLGWNCSHDLWDTLINYTWYQSHHNDGSLHQQKETALYPAFTPHLPGKTASYEYASGRWNLNFNVIDWEIARNFYVSKYLSLRPFTGLKGSWQTQTLYTSYQGILHHHQHFHYEMKQKAWFWAAGIRSGINATFHLSSSWSLFGDLALSALFSQTKAQRKDHHDIKEKQSTTSVFIKESTDTVTPVLELGLGLQKESWFYDDRFHVSVKAGWEGQVWWDQNFFIKEPNSTLGGNLTLQGLTVRLRFDF